MFQDSAFATVGAPGRMEVDYAPHNKGVTPVFRIESLIDHAASEKAGRAIYRDFECYTLFVAGDSLSASTGLVDDAIRDRFEEAYDKWKRKGQRAVVGTPLAHWPLATPRFIKEMEYLNVFSVDDLASIADVNLDKFEDGRQWRDRAAAWLKSAADGAAAARYAAENHRLRDELAALSAKVEMMVSGKPVKAPRTPMSAERRAATGARLKAAREAKRAGA